MTGSQRTETFHVLCVCTGNVFRSRLAEHYVRLGLAERLGAGGDAFVVSSAGTGVAPGRPIHPSEAAALQRLGLPADDRPSRLLSEPDVAGADLILCADRSHRAAVLELAPAALRRTFLLRELARVAGPAIALAEEQADAGGPASVENDGPETDPVERARAVIGAAATYRGFVPGGGSDDIDDPWAQPADVLASAAGLVREAVPAILDRLVGPIDGGHNLT